ncbi:TPA: DUF262 domain-containing protein [Vibrio parahaemolyticus]
MKIDTKTKKIEELFYGLNTRYFVPKYQRDYSWSVSNELPDLWIDIINAFNSRKSYFMGTILLAKHDQEDHFDIVDGQQRTVSFMLLLSVIQDYAKMVIDDQIGNDKLDCTNEDRKHIADLLYRKVSRHIKEDECFLNLTNKDSKHFERLIDVKNCNLKIEVNKSSNRVIKAKRFFQDKIEAEFFGRSGSLSQLKVFFEFVITQLKFVTITVEDDYDAYVIFESLNSKGMDLSVADLLKNKVLSNVEEGKQDRVLDDWDSIVRTIQSVPANYVDYIKCYWNAYESPDVTKNTLYKSIRNKIHSDSQRTLDFVDALLENADVYDKLKNKSKLNWPKVNLNEKWASDVAELHILGYTIYLPCFLYALNNRPDIVSPLAVRTKSLLFRWITICDYGVGEIDSLFKNILSSMKDDKSDNYILELFDPLFQKVNDKVFEENFSSYESESNTIHKYIMSKITISQDGDHVIPDYLQVDLEHILPKHYEAWKDYGLNDNFSKPYKRWIYSVGNTVLLEKGINRSLKDKPFEIKQAAFKESEFAETKELSKIDGWSEEEIKKRAKKLSKLALNIWPAF